MNSVIGADIVCYTHVFTVEGFLEWIYAVGEKRHGIEMRFFCTYCTSNNFSTTEKINGWCLAWNLCFQLCRWWYGATYNDRDGQRHKGYFMRLVNSEQRYIIRSSLHTFILDAPGNSLCFLPTLCSRLSWARTVVAILAIKPRAAISGNPTRKQMTAALNCKQ